MTEKLCRTCGCIKPLTEFRKDTHAKDGHTHRCKLCMRAYRNARYAANPDYWKAKTAEHRRKVLADPVRRKEYYYQRKLKRVLGK